MKKFLLALLLLPLALYGAAGDIKFAVKSSNNVSWLDVILAKQNNALFGTDGSGVPIIVTPGTGLTLVSGVLSSSGGGTSTNTVAASIAALKAISVSSLITGYGVQVMGYYANGDGGGGVFYYNSSSSASDNGGTIIQPTAGSGRWIRSYSDVINARWFGAKGDGISNDTTKIQAAIDQAATGDALTAPRGVVVYVPTGNYNFTVLTLRRGTIIMGDGSDLSILQKTSTTSLGLSFDSTGLTPGGIQDRITIQRLTVAQIGAATAGAGISVNSVSSYAQAVIEDVHVQNTYVGIALFDTINTWLKNTEVFYSITDGFLLTGQHYKLTATDCYASTNGIGGTGNGFNFTGGRYCVLTGCGSDNNPNAGYKLTSCVSVALRDSGAEGNQYGAYLDVCLGSFVQDFYAVITAPSINAVYLNNCTNTDLDGISSSINLGTNATYQVVTASGTGNRYRAGYIANAWPSGTAASGYSSGSFLLTEANTQTTLATTLLATGEIITNSNFKYAGATAGALNFISSSASTQTHAIQSFYNNGANYAPLNIVGGTTTFNISGTNIGAFSSSGLGLIASSYLNFGPTAGSTGYGIRDNGGTMEVKNSGGAWASIGGGGSGTVTTSGSPASGQAAEFTSSTAITGVSVTGTGSYAKSITPTFGTSIKFTNATSGTITLQPVTGALGTPTVSIPATTGTMGVTTGTLTNGNLASFDSSGRLQDSGGTTIPTVTISAGAGDVGKIQVLNASGLHDVSTLVALTGDITKPAGSAATTLATVNSNVGSFTAANITVNAKGLVTAASNGSGGSAIDNISGQSVLGSSYTITADSTFENTGLSVSIPSAGTYLISFNVREQTLMTTGQGYIQLRLFDVTNSAAIANSDRMTYITTTLASNQQAESAYSAIITTAGAITLRLEAERNVLSGSWSSANITSDTAGYTTLSYVKLQ